MSLSIWRERCRKWQERNLERALAHFTFIADVTTLAPNCRFAGDAETFVACYEGLPFIALAFHSHASSARTAGAPARIRALTRKLVAPGEEAWCLIGDEQWSVAQAAYRVLEVREEWQMLFHDDPAAFDAGDAVALTRGDMPEAAALARREGLMAFEDDPLARGPWYGVRREGTLIAQGGTHVLLDRAAEIGNIVTAQSHRRQGYGSQVVAALVRALHARGKAVFLQVLKDNGAAVACYERLGFERLRTMYLAKVKAPAASRGVLQRKKPLGACSPQTSACHSSPTQAVGHSGFFHVSLS